MPRLYTDYTKDKDGKEIWNFKDVEHINFYLNPGPEIYVKSRSEPLCYVPKMIYGNMPLDNGNLILSEQEKNILIKKFPESQKFVKICIGGREFLHNEKRYCLWLVDASPEEIKKNKFIYERVKAVKEFRLKSKRTGTKKAAETPHLFAEIRQSDSNYIAIPQVSSEKRKYIPMDYLGKEIIATNQLLTIPNADDWLFGILESNVHMIWTKTVCGRLTSRIRYSAKIVYNNFPFMRMEFLDYMKLTLSAKKILSVRKKYPDSSLADLYDEITMPKELRDAHKENDKIVMKIYGFDDSMTELEISNELLERYKFISDWRADNPKKKLEEFDDEDLQE